MKHLKSITAAVPEMNLKQSVAAADAWGPAGSRVQFLIDYVNKANF